MGDLPGGSIDLILADLPYGTTACRWDVIIPFEPLWAHYRRLLKPRGAVVLTASQPFTSMLVMSNREWFKYDWAWDKKSASGFLNAKKMPMRAHEHVLVFAPEATTYNPEKIARTEAELKRFAKSDKAIPGRSGAYRATSWTSWPTRENRKFKGPTSVIRINGLCGGRDRERGLHPTQKPVALMEYLIKTYSNKYDSVLDNCMGSGTTGIACLNTGRDFIGIESDPAYLAIAERRIRSAMLPLFGAQ
jgi:site-specific DNA-methyltransferase (adenine-specific)